MSISYMNEICIYTIRSLKYFFIIPALLISGVSVRADTNPIDEAQCEGIIFGSIVTPNDYLKPTSPSSVWGEMIENSSLVKHLPTGLIYKRCFVGQSYDEATNSCTGSPKVFSIKEALDYVKTLEEGNWRIPNLTETLVTVEYCSAQPAQNTNVFPFVRDGDNTSGTLLTSTPVPTDSTELNQWYVIYNSIGRVYEQNEPSGFIRLVRDNN